jgi:hypothetical protein
VGELAGKFVKLVISHKHQITSTKLQINSNEPKDKNSKQNHLGDLELGLGDYLGFGVWNLEF